MVTDILVVLLIFIGLGTVVYCILKFAFWFIDELRSLKNKEKEKNYAAMKEEMEQIDQQTLNLAYLYVKNLVLYGADVTEKWETATEQSANLEKAYRKGFYEGIRKTTGIPDNATNGDVIETLFDIKEVEEMGYCTFITIYPDYNTRFIKEWWNAPYKEKK